MPAPSHFVEGRAHATWTGVTKKMSFDRGGADLEATNRMPHNFEVHETVFLKNEN